MRRFGRTQNIWEDLERFRMPSCAGKSINRRRRKMNFRVCQNTYKKREYVTWSKPLSNSKAEYSVRVDKDKRKKALSRERGVVAF
jgi:hypothetical protein